MALYKSTTYVTQVSDEAFDKIHEPGSTTPFSAIYRCEGCGHEIVSEEQKPFPPQNHPQHTAAQGRIRWRMVVYAQHKQ